MKLGDKAEQSDRDEVRLARDSVGAYRLESDELVPADEISADDEFPKYGDFLATRELRQVSGEVQVGEKVLVEVPGALAKQLVEHGIGEGDGFRIQSVRKNAAGEWEYGTSEERLPSDE
jgi:hypothetical protein